MFTQHVFDNWTMFNSIIAIVLFALAIWFGVFTFLIIKEVNETYDQDEYEPFAYVPR